MDREPGCGRFSFTCRLQSSRSFLVSVPSTRKPPIAHIGGEAMEPLEDVGLGRREFLYFLGGLGAANAIGLGSWLTLEALVPRGNADEYHKSVCRYCGTGCGIRVGLRNGQISDVRGDELAHNRGVICVKGATLGSLLHISGRLTNPKIRRDGKLIDASWDEAMGLVARTFQEAIRD